MLLRKIIEVRLGKLKIVLRILFCMTFNFFICEDAAVDHIGHPYDMIGLSTVLKMSSLFAIDNFDFGVSSGNSALKHLLVLLIAFVVC